MERKRKAQLKRKHIADEPPRKRQTKKILPKRMPVVLAEAKPSTNCFANMEMTCPITLKTEEHSPPEFDSEQVVGEPQALGPEAIWIVNSTNTDLTEEWLHQFELSDDDDDLTEHLTSTRQILNAVAEPACVTDVTTFEAKVLQVEDSASDQVLRKIVTTDECYSFTWSADRKTFLGQREVFSGIPGPTFEITDRTKPVEIFDRMFDVDFIDLLCVETNRYAEQKLALMREQNKLTSHSRFRRWTPTDRDEMVSFLALRILQGLYPLPEEEAYFKYNGFGTMPYFSKIMSYNRFLLLKIMLHFVDNETVKDTTKLCKIRPIIDYFNRQFSSLYMPSQEVAIDESSLKWTGRLSFSQKINSKAKVGIKTYELCESSSGYLWKFSVYAGKDKPRSTDEQMDRPHETTEGPDDDRLTNATAKIVCDLIKPLFHRGHTLIMDNFYNSPLLLRHLKRQQTDCYGTLRLNREFVPDNIKALTKTDLRQGEAVTTYCSDLSILVWRDGNIFSMISTYHNLQVGTSDKNNRLTCKPSIVLDYNKTMGGIDRKDQFLLAQAVERVKNKVWYRKLFGRLYNAAIFNCFVIFSSVHRKISHRRFRTILAEDLIKRHKLIDLTTECILLNNRTSAQKSVSTPKTLARRNLTQTEKPSGNFKHNHYPIKTGSKHTVCRLCPKKTRTVWKCEECNVNLCILHCFKAYHHSLEQQN